MTRLQACEVLHTNLKYLREHEYGTYARLTIFVIKVTLPALILSRIRADRKVLEEVIILHFRLSLITAEGKISE